MAERPIWKNRVLKDKVIFINRVARSSRAASGLALLPWSLSATNTDRSVSARGKRPKSRKRFEKRSKRQETDGQVSLKNTTIPYTVMGHFGAEDVLLKPASEGTALLQEDRFGRSWMF